jgi:hypothetical protein
MWTICHSVTDEDGKQTSIEDLSEDKTIEFYEQLEAVSESDEDSIPDNIILRDMYQCTEPKDLMRSIFSTAYEDSHILAYRVLENTKIGLVEMAADDKLPLDLNEIDMESVINGSSE